jgi:predicted GNAT family acetyltransferase
MFRRILPGREAEALAFLAREPEINHFILGDIECFGLGDPNLGLWAEERDGISAVLLRYYGSFIIYAPEGADSRHAARIMRDCGYGMLSGRPEYVQPVLEHLGIQPEIHANVYMRLLPGGLRPSGCQIEAVNVDLENLDEYLDGIVDLRRCITEFSMGINVEALRDELKLGCKRIVIAMEGGRVVAMVMTTVERKQAAMIVSVCTREECRGKGYAPALMTELCRQLESEGKTAILFYSNPVAGRIYSSLGFEDIGRWCFASFG